MMEVQDNENVRKKNKASSQIEQWHGPLLNDRDQHATPSLEQCIIEATKANDIDQIRKLLTNRDDQKLYGKLVAEIAAENGHIGVFELLRGYGIINVGNALQNAGECVVNNYSIYGRMHANLTSCDSFHVYLAYLVREVICCEGDLLTSTTTHSLKV
jgi:hypothetical protein